MSDPAGTRIAVSTIGLVPITDIMTPDPICVPRGLAVDVALELVLRKYIGCLPVIDETRTPIGMITKRDLLERLAAGQLLATLTAADVMLPLAFTLTERATVAQAAALMANEDIHHLPVVSEAGAVIGVVSTLDVVRWLARKGGYAG